jgi:hypothetical protein
MKELRKNLLLMSNGVSTGGIMLKVKVTSKGQAVNYQVFNLAIRLCKRQIMFHGKTFKDRI